MYTLLNFFLFDNHLLCCGRHIGYSWTRRQKLQILRNLMRCLRIGLSIDERDGKAYRNIKNDMIERRIEKKKNICRTYNLFPNLLINSWDPFWLFGTWINFKNYIGRGWWIPGAVGSTICIDKTMRIDEEFKCCFNCDH